MRIFVFIDFWNFQLTANDRVGVSRGINNFRMQVDWANCGKALALEACKKLGVQPAQLVFQGSNIYTSYNPRSPESTKFKNWALNWLNRQPGVHVEMRERRPKALPRCTTCHKEISHCPHSDCRQPIAGTGEKGVDTLVVTDLIRYAIQNTYDAAVIVSSDADMIPAVDFVQSSLGKKVIQAGFPPIGVDLATSCWANFDVLQIVNQVERAPKPSP